MMLAIKGVVNIFCIEKRKEKVEAINHNDTGNTVYSNYNILHSKKKIKKIKTAMNHNDAGNKVYSNLNILHNKK